MRLDPLTEHTLHPEKDMGYWHLSPRGLLAAKIYREKLASLVRLCFLLLSSLLSFSAEGDGLCVCWGVTPVPFLIWWRWWWQWCLDSLQFPFPLHVSYVGHCPYFTGQPLVPSRLSPFSLFFFFVSCIKFTKLLNCLLHFPCLFVHLFCMLADFVHIILWKPISNFCQEWL